MEPPEASDTRGLEHRSACIPSLPDRILGIEIHEEGPAKTRLQRRAGPAPMPMPPERTLSAIPHTGRVKLAEPYRLSAADAAGEFACGLPSPASGEGAKWRSGWSDTWQEQHDAALRFQLHRFLRTAQAAPTPEQARPLRALSIPTPAQGGKEDWYTACVPEAPRQLQPIRALSIPSSAGSDWSAGDGLPEPAACANAHAREMSSSNAKGERVPALVAAQGSQSGLVPGGGAARGNLRGLRSGAQAAADGASRITPEHRPVPVPEVDSGRASTQAAASETQDPGCSTKVARTPSLFGRAETPWQQQHRAALNFEIQRILRRHSAGLQGPDLANPGGSVSQVVSAGIWTVGDGRVPREGGTHGSSVGAAEEAEEGGCGMRRPASHSPAGRRRPVRRPPGPLERSFSANPNALGRGNGLERASEESTPKAVGTGRAADVPEFIPWGTPFERESRLRRLQRKPRGLRRHKSAGTALAWQAADALKSLELSQRAGLARHPKVLKVREPLVHGGAAGAAQTPWAGHGVPRAAHAIRRCLSERESTLAAQHHHPFSGVPQETEERCRNSVHATRHARKPERSALKPRSTGSGAHHGVQNPLIDPLVESICSSDSSACGEDQDFSAPRAAQQPRHALSHPAQPWLPSAAVPRGRRQGARRRPSSSESQGGNESDVGSDSSS